MIRPKIYLSVITYRRHNVLAVKLLTGDSLNLLTYTGYSKYGGRTFSGEQFYCLLKVLYYQLTRFPLEVLGAVQK